MCVTITVVNVGNVNLVKRREVIDVNVTDDDATACAFSRGCCKINGIARHKSCLWSTAHVRKI
jgi:hypothetical protein